LGCYVSLMAKEDVPQVVEIDRKAFPAQQPTPDYYHELDNRLAHYLVVCSDELEDKVVPGNPARRGIQRLASRLKQALNQERAFSPRQRRVLGFAGFWLMANEAHITSIAVREEYRRCGLGELLLLCLIELAREARASLVTLEVRISNSGAQALYSRYGFVEVGIRRGYYTDNGEDAVLMTMDRLGSASVRERLERLVRDAL